MRVFLLFVDGMGLGDSEGRANPLVSANMPALRSLLGGAPLTRASVPYRAPGVFAAVTDARLGVAGLPQSATGQTAIFTGQNAPAAIGRHLNGYPTPNLKAILNAHSIFKQVEALGGRSTFLNGFPPAFFEWVAQGQPLFKDRRYRPSASTVAGLAAGVHIFRTLEQLRAGDAVGFDIDHAVMRERGYDLPPVDPGEAGRRAARIAGEHHFTLYEHFLTDKAGHAQDPTVATEVLERLDRFIGGVLEALPADVTLMITSDHGNVEDLTVKTHTYNDVATILKGPSAEAAGGSIRSLLDLTPAIVTVLGGEAPAGL